MLPSVKNIIIFILSYPAPVKWYFPMVLVAIALQSSTRWNLTLAETGGKLLDRTYANDLTNQLINKSTPLI
jgi:hypothetical protein